MFWMPLITHGTLAGEPEREQFRQFCRLLGAIYHYEYFDQLERLRNDYFYFNPELDDHARFDAAKVERAYGDLIETLTNGASRRQLRRSPARGDRARRIATTPLSASTSEHRWTTTARSDFSAAAITGKRSKFANGSAGASAASSSMSMTTSSCWSR